MTNHPEVKELVDAYVLGGDFEAALDQARAEVAPPRPRWLAPLVAVAAAAALAVAAFPPRPVVAPPPAAAQAPEADAPIGVGRLLLTGSETAVVEADVADPDVVELRHADPHRFAVVGLARGETEVTLRLEDGAEEVRRYRVVDQVAPAEGEVWADLAPGAIVDLGAVDSISVADPRRAHAATTDAGGTLLLGRSEGITDVVLRRGDHWHRLTVHVGPGDRLAEGWERLRGEPRTLAVGERLVLGGTAVSARPEVVEVVEQDSELALRAVGRGRSTVWVDGPEGATVLHLTVD